jgi:hypothetical protein
MSIQDYLTLRTVRYEVVLQRQSLNLYSDVYIYIYILLCTNYPFTSQHVSANRPSSSECPYITIRMRVAIVYRLYI